jgi:FtsH-binding integral membrane protein
MDLETTFLAAFYAVLGLVTSAVLLVILASNELVSLLVVVVAMFAMMALMLWTTLERDDRAHKA